MPGEKSLPVSGLQPRTSHSSIAYVTTQTNEAVNKRKKRDNLYLLDLRSIFRYQIERVE